MPYGLSTGDRNGESNRRDDSTETRNEDEYHSTTPNCQSFTSRRSGTVAIEDHNVTGCPIHNSEENSEHGVFSDDDGGENNETSRSDDNDNCDNNANMRTGVRKTSLDDKPLIRNNNEFTKSNKKGSKHCQRKTTKKHPSNRKQISYCCPCPTKTIPDAKISKPSPKRVCSTRKHPRCHCQAIDEANPAQDEEPDQSSKGCSTVCTVISQRICIGKRRATTRPMTPIQSEQGWRHSQ